jgi:hypothetical protein
MKCRTGCPTQDHVSWGECLRASSIQLNTGDAKASLISSGWTQKKWDNELKEYRDARAQGIQPKSTKTADIRAAVKHSDTTGVAYQAR